MRSFLFVGGSLFFLFLSYTPVYIAVAMSQTNWEQGEKEERFPSGWLRRYEKGQTKSPSSYTTTSLETAPLETVPIETMEEKEEEFIQKYFPLFSSQKLAWKRQKRFIDSTHLHDLFSLRYQGFLISHSSLKLHLNRTNGEIEYVSSSAPGLNKVEGSLSALFEIQPEKEKNQKQENSLFQKILKTLKIPKAEITKIEPIIWLEKESLTGRPAYEIELTTNKEAQHIYLDAEDLRILEKLPTLRFVSVTNQIYPRFPPLEAPKTLGTLFSTELLDLLDSHRLQSTSIHVRKSTSILSAGNIILTEVDPNTNFSAQIGFSNDPALYNPNCLGTNCPNQNFDAINIYYHLQKYRRKINQILSTLGATVNFSEPLEVIANHPGFSSGENEYNANNAAFAKPCPVAGFTEGCLLFLPPASTSSSLCGGGTKEVYNLAREAAVIVHEYQHYITDQITHVVKGDSLAYVADALHEGFSDYFGLSHISQDSGVTTSSILKYAFLNCSPLQREIGEPVPFDSNTPRDGYYEVGVIWASGLWQIRNRLGVERADTLIIKSLFFLPTEPGYIDAVESLVKADQALHQGENTSYIRTLFYSTLRFLEGTGSGAIDTRFGKEKMIVNLGFQSCSGVHLQAHKELQQSFSFKGSIIQWILFLSFLMGGYTFSVFLRKQIFPFYLKKE